MFSLYPHDEAIFFINHWIIMSKSMHIELKGVQTLKEWRENILTIGLPKSSWPSRGMQLTSQLFFFLILHMNLKSGSVLWVILKVVIGSVVSKIDVFSSL